MFGIVVALILLLVAAWLLRKVILVVLIAGAIVGAIGVGVMIFRHFKEIVE